MVNPAVHVGAPAVKVPERVPVDRAVVQHRVDHDRNARCVGGVNKRLRTMAAYLDDQL